MKISKVTYALVIGLLVSTAVYAASKDETENLQDMPMTNQDGSMMMNQEMMQQMMESGTMSPEMMQQMMASGQHGKMHRMDGSMMMSPEMMQMRMQHMAKMEQHLEKIESLLTQILEAQKSK